MIVQPYLLSHLFLFDYIKANIKHFRTGKRLKCCLNYRQPDSYAVRGPSCWQGVMADEKNSVTEVLPSEDFQADRWAAALLTDPGYAHGGP